MIYNQKLIEKIDDERLKRAVKFAENIVAEWHAVEHNSQTSYVECGSYFCTHFCIMVGELVNSDKEEPDWV